MVQSLTDRVDAILREAFAALNLPTEAARAMPGTRPDLADLQCNGAMPAAKALGRDPRSLSSEIARLLSARAEFASVSVAGPGFINMRLAGPALAEAAGATMADPKLGLADEGCGRLVVVDFGGPNVAKPLHVGHLRSLVIGESLRRILAALGWRVLADAHLGDWGLQMGMLTSQIRLRIPSAPWFDRGHAGPWPDEAPVTLDELERLYPEAAEACRADPLRLAAARADTAALQAGDAGLTALWRRLRDLSLQAQRRDFAALGVTFDLLLGESDVDPLIAPLVADLRSRGIAVESDGALVVEVGGEGTKRLPPLLLAKRDGAALYATTDLATLQDRVQRLRAHRILYIVDQRQALHFEQVFRAAGRAGLADGVELRHVGFGTVNGADGKPYKTRQGGVARLVDLLDDAVAKAAERIAESQYSAELAAAGRADLARQVGIGAVKFADLSGDRLSGYVFDPDRLVSFEGHTGPYVQYACVRIRSVLAKAAAAGHGPGAIVPLLDPERSLLLAACRFAETASEAARQLQPGILADYAFMLAQTFNRFYTACPILAAETDAQRRSRLAMAQLTEAILARALDLLGIEVPAQM